MMKRASLLRKTHPCKRYLKAVASYSRHPWFEPSRKLYRKDENYEKEAGNG